MVSHRVQFLFSEGFLMCNYADDCSPYEVSLPLEDVIHKLEEYSLVLMEWYESNYLKPNPDKWHLLLSEVGDKYAVQIGNEMISNSAEQKILGIYFDNKLNFKCHLNKLCGRASQKIHALARVSNFMSFKQRKLIMDAFISSQFNYCPLIWMCHSRGIHTQINRIHERALRIVYKDNTLSFEKLLEKSGSVTIHHRNIQLLAIEICKALNNLSSPLMAELFKIKESNYHLRKADSLMSNKPSSTTYGIGSITHLAPKIWEQIPAEMKCCKTLKLFKSKLKLWIPNKCPCRLCKVYVQHVGFIN